MSESEMETSCRCGWTFGSGKHQCHAGRGSDDRCLNEAAPILLLSNTSLAGMQNKLEGIWAYYCPACFQQAFGRPHPSFLVFDFFEIMMTK